jgi:transposase
VVKFRSLEHLMAQVTVVRWHLDAAGSGNDEKKRRHLDSALLTYQGAVELLAQLALSNEAHAAITQQLAELKGRLQAAGQPV